MAITHLLHFGRSMKVNTYLKKWLSHFHDGYLWMDTKFPIMVNLISQITGFPKEGVNSYQCFKGNDNEKKIAVRLKKRYDVICDKREYVISTINEKGFQIASKLLAMKIVYKNKPNHYTS